MTQIDREEACDAVREILDGWCDWSMNGRLREGGTFTREEVYEDVHGLLKTLLGYEPPPERIVAAAVRTKSFFNDHVLVYQVSPPGRHCDLMPVGDPKAEARMEQGFVTSSGRFVDRHEGKRIAEAAGQLLERAGKTASLYSEDLW